MTRLQVLVTGSAGLVGGALSKALVAAGHRVVGLDLRASGPDHGDVRDPARVRRALHGCDGVVHLAAVSRVVVGERDPQLCWDTNVHGLVKLITAVEQRSVPPWVVFASSREVYGQAGCLPVMECAPLRPVNVYARSKVEGEALVSQAGERGLRTAIVRLSNVYGRTDDHPDRVIPAFARAAAFGGAMRVEGGDNLFDFTHVDDVVQGLLRLVERLAPERAVTLPPIQFVTGQALSLDRLALLAKGMGDARTVILHAPPRRFDVARFCGCWSRAHALLGWVPQIPVPVGLARLIDEMRAEASSAPSHPAGFDGRMLYGSTAV